MTFLCLLMAIAIPISVQLYLPAHAQGVGENAAMSGLGAGLGAALGSSAAHKASEQNKATKDRYNRESKQAAAAYNLALREEKSGKKAEAARLFGAYAAYRERLTGGRDRLAIDVYDRAAGLLRKSGHRVEADAYSERALACCKQLYGKDSPQVMRRLEAKKGQAPAKGSSKAGASAGAPGSAKSSGKRSGAR